MGSMTYFVIKLIHITSSTILLWTAVGSAFFMILAGRLRDVGLIHQTARFVVIADRVVIAPALLLQLGTGCTLVYLAGFQLMDFWLVSALGLLIVAGACWIPVMQTHTAMRNMSAEADKAEHPLPDDYQRLDQRWMMFGTVALAAIGLIFYLMVFKPHGL